MRLLSTTVPLTMLAAFAACGGTDATTTCCTEGEPALRVVNGFTGPIDVLVDGSIAIRSLAAGSIGLAAPTSGNHTLALRASGSASTRSLTTTPGVLATFAAVRSESGDIGAVALDDTNAVVPDGATKVRVIHFAPNAGTLQVYRTQPDYQHPVSWQFPFDYQPDPTTLTAPFYRSTVGTWEIRAWRSPADSSGWSHPEASVVIPLASGEKKTVVILDKEGGGIRMETF